MTALQTLSPLPGYRADVLGHNSEPFLSSEEGKEKGGFCLACLFALRCFKKIIQLPCLAIVSHIASPSSCQKYRENPSRT